MRKPPKFTENRGRPEKYDYPKKKGDLVTAGIASRQTFYSHARRGKYKIRTWWDDVTNQLIIERL
jgi:hypothetical protein